MELNINEHPPVITAKKIEVYLTETWRYNYHLTIQPPPNYCRGLITYFDNRWQPNPKQRERYAPVSKFNKLSHYMFFDDPVTKLEHFSSLAAVHQTFEIIGYRFRVNRAFHTLNDQVSHFYPYVGEVVRSFNHNNLILKYNLTNSHISH